MPDETETKQKAKPVAPPDDGVRELRPVTIFNGQNSGVTKDFRPRQESADAPAPTKATTAPPAREEQSPRLPTPPAEPGKDPAAQGENEPPVPPVEPTEEPPLIPDPADDDGKPKGKKK